MTKYRLYYERQLPHYQPPGATLFITFRLADSLPQVVLRQLKQAAQILEADLSKIADQQAYQKANYEAQKQLFGKWDAHLDHLQYGPDWLADPRVAEIMCEALHYRDQKEFILEAYCLMPNHVHLVCTPLVNGDESLPIAKIMHSLKGYTARQANLLLNRSGFFWQHESYDHVVRDTDEFARIVNYVLENPVRAGLDARWVYRKVDKLEENL